MRVNFTSSKDTGETRTIYVWGDNASIMRGCDADDIIRERFRSFLHSYQEELKIISGYKFNFEQHKWATINPKNKMMMNTTVVNNFCIKV